jgi:hypothetical protein
MNVCSNIRVHYLTGLTLFLCLSSASAFGQRSEVVDLANSVAEHASDAALYARRAYNASSLRELREYARKVRLAAEEGESEAADAAALAEDYGCDDAAIYLQNAESSLSDATTYARRAYNADSFDDAQYYIRNARIAAEEAESEALNAANECEE